MKVVEILRRDPPEEGRKPSTDLVLAKKIERMNQLRDENNEPEAPASGTFYQRMIGRPPIPLK